MLLKTATALDPRHKHLRCIPPEQRDEVWKNVENLTRLQMQSSKDEVVSPHREKFGLFWKEKTVFV